MISRLPGSGSAREYFRLQAGDQRAIGAVGREIAENRAFFSFTKTFRDHHCPVPELYGVSGDETCYLMTDLGDVTLFSLLGSVRKAGDGIPAEAMDLYRKVIRRLPAFQVGSAPDIDYARCYPRDAFDARSMMWDLNYFKYYFLKLAGISYDEEALEEDFLRLTAFLCEPGQPYFLYRDFQSRNIMIVNSEPWFIDYQGGRKGALQYDIASLLYDAKADLPEQTRDLLLEEYLSALSQWISYDRADFLKYYDGFVLVRILQSLGTYGFRGYYENKPHFLRSIPFALKNLQSLKATGRLNTDLPALMKVIGTMTVHPHLAEAARPAADLTVTIQSFSYRNGIPEDLSGHGGGFVFDCRALPNPGRLEEFMDLTGKDEPVIRFLRKERAVDEFLNHASSLADMSVRNYIERGFRHLSIRFGCTGGQHRSVYCAEELAVYLKSKYDIRIVIQHLELSS